MELIQLAETFAANLVREAVRAEIETLGADADKRSAGTATFDELVRALLAVPMKGPRYAAIESALIAEALRMSPGNQSAAARLLGMPRRVMLRRHARVARALSRRRP